jgi:hypothetical protein
MQKQQVTEELYIVRLKSYCDNVDKNPDQLIALKLEGQQNRNTPKEFQAEELFEKLLRQDTYLDAKKEKRTYLKRF